MMEFMGKTTSINIRVTPEFKSELEALANHHAISPTSMAHSLLVRAVRQAKVDAPEAFATKPALTETPERIIKHKTEAKKYEPKRKAS